MTDLQGGQSPGRGLHFGALPAGYPLGHYRFQSVIGVGGFGITYRAIDERLRRPVAIKEFLPTDFAIRVGGVEVKPRSPSDQEMFSWGLKRFLDEARVLAALNDAPNIVHVYDYLEANGTGYMVMELIEGEPLDKVLARTGRIPAQSILPMLPSLLKGLEAVHRAGYLHRDIKPGNILVRTSGEPVLVDFGAARMSMGQRTQVMTSIYSPGYAPPEQYAFGVDANKQGPASDIYALAATLYHAITGSAPADAVRRLAKDNYVPLTQSMAGQFPPGFLAAVDAALSLPIDRRPQSVAAWSQMLFGDSLSAGPGPASVGGPAAGLFGAGPPSTPGMTPAGALWPPGTAGGPAPAPLFDPAVSARGAPPPAYPPVQPGPPSYRPPGGQPTGPGYPPAPGYPPVQTGPHAYPPQTAGQPMAPAYPPSQPGAPPSHPDPRAYQGQPYPSPVSQPGPAPYQGQPYQGQAYQGQPYPTPPAHYQDPRALQGAPPAAPAKRRGGAGLWIALGGLLFVLLAAGVGAYYYLCTLNTYCSGTDDTVACNEDLARVRADIQRVLARLPGQSAPTPDANLSCREQLAKAKAELARLEELARSQPPVEPKPPTPPVEPKPPVDTPTPPVVEPKPPVDTPQPPVVEPKPPVDTPQPPVVEPKPPVDTPQPPVVEPKPPVDTPQPPVVEPKPPTPPVQPKPPVVEPKPPPVTPKPPVVQPKPPPPPPSDPTRYSHEGHWFGSANVMREARRGQCPPTFTLNGVVKDNIFNGSSSLGAVSVRIRSNTKRVADISVPGMSVRSASGTFDSFTFETSTGCIYSVRMFRQ